MTGLTDPQFAALIGLAGGVPLGLAARIGRFCTLGAIEDVLYGGSDHRLRMWGLAIATAILGSFGLMAVGALDAGAVPYLRGGWNPFAHIVGGLLFGYGMALAGNCGYGALARLGGGDLRSFVIVLVMGISAYVVLAGPLAPLRVALFPPDLLAGPVGLAHLGAAATGIAAPLLGLAAGAALLALVLCAQSFRRDRSMLVWGAVVGLAIVWGWAGSQWLADRSFEAIPVQSYTAAQPLGEAILFAMTSGAGDLTFPIGAMLGIWGGAFLGTLIKGHFRWEACDDPRELRRQIFGAVLMGVGAILALGCTLGQGISALSVLAIGAPLSFAAIAAGAAFGLRRLILGGLPA